MLGSSEGEAAASDGTLIYTVISICTVTLACSLLIVYGLRHFKISPAVFPDSWVHLLVGGLISIILELGPIANLDLVVSKVTNSFEEIFFALLLPPVLFEAGLTLNAKDFFSGFWVVTNYAVLGVLVSGMVIGLLLFLFSLIPAPGIVAFSFLDALLFGTILSATDTIAVIQAMGELKVPKQLYNLVFGESTLNDASVIALFRVSGGATSV